MAKQSIWNRLNIFEKQEPQKLAEMPAEVRVIHIEPEGSSGTDITGGVLNEEFLQELTGTQAADLWDKMRRSDGKIKMCINAVLNPLKSGNWEIDAANDSPEAEKQAELARFVFFEGMETPWNRLLHEIFSQVTFGFSLFERIHKVNFDHPKFGNFISYKNFAFRSQRTIEFWNINPDTEALESVTQQAFGDAQSTNVDIPAKFLTLFSIDREGSNYEGISMLRSAYGPWLRKRSKAKLEIIGQEKFAVPTPLLKIPEGKEGTEEYTNATEVLRRFTSHQCNFLTFPEGWDLELFNSNFNSDSLLKSMAQDDQEIIFAFLANFLLLGASGGGGAFALARDLSDFFLNGLTHIANGVCDELNGIPMKEIIDLNFGKQADYPKLKCSGLSDKAGEEFSNILKNLADSQYLTPDDKLEDHLRKRMGIPERSDIGQRLPKPSTPPVGFSEETTELAEKKNAARTQINKGADQIREISSRNLKKIGRSMTDQVINNFQRLPDSKRFDATKGVKQLGRQDYEKELLQAFVDLSDKALEQAKREVPLAKVKTKEIKFAEFESLPPDTQKRLKNRSRLLVDDQLSGLEKAVFFQFSSEIDKPTSDAAKQQAMNEKVDKEAEGPGVVAGSITGASATINEARNAFFFTDDVLEELQAFQFFNPAPVSVICRDLAGRIFSKEDIKSQEFLPPLHFNCKSTILPILNSAKNVRISSQGLEPSNQASRNSINLSEALKCGTC